MQFRQDLERFVIAKNWDNAEVDQMNAKLNQYMGRIENLIKMDEIRKVRIIV